MFQRREVLSGNVPNILVPVENLIQASIYEHAPRLSRFDYVSPKGQLRGRLGKSWRETWIRSGEKRIPKGAHFLAVDFVPSHFTADSRDSVQKVIADGLKEYIDLINQLEDNPKFKDVEYVGDVTHPRLARLLVKRLGFTNYWLNPWVNGEICRLSDNIFASREEIVQSRSAVLALQSRMEGSKWPF